MKHFTGAPVLNLGQFFDRAERSLFFFLVILGILNYTFTLTRFYFVEFYGYYVNKE